MQKKCKKSQFHKASHQKLYTKHDKASLICSILVCPIEKYGSGFFGYFVVAATSAADFSWFYRNTCTVFSEFTMPSRLPICILIIESPTAINVISVMSYMRPLRKSRNLPKTGEKKEPQRCISRAQNQGASTNPTCVICIALSGVEA